MSKDIFSSLKNNDISSLCNECMHNPHYLVMHKKTVSQLVALFLLVAFFIFAVGYFLGKKKLAEDFSHIVEQANFSDQINFALTTLYDQDTPMMQVVTENNNEIKSQNDQSVVQKTDLEKQEMQVLPEMQSKNDNNINKKYIAQLFGGTQKAVSQFAQRLLNKGIVVEIRNRTSKTAKGKTIHWYQAVTQPYENENDLKSLIAMIQKLEKINNVTILQRPHANKL